MTDNLQSLFDVLNHRLLRVAEYQRPYAWETKQLEDLWGDLDLVGKDAHYAGTLVLQKTDVDLVESSSGTDLITFDVVDGQQRLTTCILLLDRLRRAMEALPPDAHEGLDEAIVDLKRLVHVRAEGVDRIRLELATEFHHYWAQNLLQGVPYTGQVMIGGQRRLHDAADFFEDRLATLGVEVTPKVAAERLIDLKKRIGRLRFLVYPVETSAEVGVLFETLNERGQTLSELEKVKNYLLYLARQLPTAQQASLGERSNEPGRRSSRTPLLSLGQTTPYCALTGSPPRTLGPENGRGPRRSKPNSPLGLRARVSATGSGRHGRP